MAAPNGEGGGGETGSGQGREGGGAEGGQGREEVGAGCGLDGEEAYDGGTVESPTEKLRIGEQEDDHQEASSTVLCTSSRILYHIRSSLPTVGIPPIRNYTQVLFLFSCPSLI